VLEDLLARGIAEGRLAADVTLDDAMVRLVAPPRRPGRA
jgi:hypothetical protein